MMLATTDVRFELEQFTWGAPDRFQLSGTFVGMRDVPLDPPVLVLSSPDQTHRLPAVDGTVSGSPADGRPWSAEFAWQQPPVPFDVAAVHFGDAMVVELPEPGTKAFRFRKHAMKVHVTAAEPSPEHAEPRAEQAEPTAEPAEEPAKASAERAEPSAEPGEPGAERADPVPGADQLRLESQLLVAEDEARELRAELEQSRAELARAREDLESERARHAEDAQRFRDGLAHVQESAEAALGQLRAELEEAAAARAGVDERMAGLETTRGEAAAALSDAEQLLSRLTAIRDALGDGS
jgi:hypothetical protein